MKEGVDVVSFGNTFSLGKMGCFHVNCFLERDSFVTGLIPSSKLGTNLFLRQWILRLTHHPDDCLSLDDHC